MYSSWEAPQGCDVHIRSGFSKDVSVHHTFQQILLYRHSPYRTGTSVAIFLQCRDTSCSPSYADYIIAEIRMRTQPWSSRLFEAFRYLLAPGRVTPLNLWLFFRFAFSSRVTRVREAQACERISKLKNKPWKKAGLCGRVTGCVTVFVNKLWRHAKCNAMSLCGTLF